MTRSKIRENVFKMLFRVEFHDKSELAEQMELLNDELTNPTDEERQYIDEKCSAIIEHMAELDALIDEKSTGWKTNRMAKVDLAIIRLAVYEIKFEVLAKSGTSFCVILFCFDRILNSFDIITKTDYT